VVRPSGTEPLGVVVDSCKGSSQVLYRALRDGWKALFLGRQARCPPHSDEAWLTVEGEVRRQRSRSARLLAVGHPGYGV